MTDKPTRLKVWWSASIAAAAVFIAMIFIASIGAALITAGVIYALTLFGGYRMRTGT